MFGGNSFLKDSLIKQKIDYYWGFYMLFLSALSQILYILLS